MRAHSCDRLSLCGSYSLKPSRGKQDLGSKETNYFQGKVLPLLRTTLLPPSPPVSGMANRPGRRSLPKGHFPTLYVIGTILECSSGSRASLQTGALGCSPTSSEEGAPCLQSGQPSLSSAQAAHPGCFCVRLPLGCKHPAQVLEGKIMRQSQG